MYLYTHSLFITVIEGTQKLDLLCEIIQKRMSFHTGWLDYVIHGPIVEQSNRIDRELSITVIHFAPCSL